MACTCGCLDLYKPDCCSGFSPNINSPFSMLQRGGVGGFQPHDPYTDILLRDRELELARSAQSYLRFGLTSTTRCWHPYLYAAAIYPGCTTATISCTPPPWSTAPSLPNSVSDFIAAQESWSECYQNLKGELGQKRSHESLKREYDLSRHDSPSKFQRLGYEQQDGAISHMSHDIDYTSKHENSKKCAGTQTAFSSFLPGETTPTYLRSGATINDPLHHHPRVPYTSHVERDTGSYAMNGHLHQPHHGRRSFSPSTNNNNNRGTVSTMSSPKSASDSSRSHIENGGHFRQQRSPVNLSSPLSPNSKKTRSNNNLSIISSNSYSLSPYHQTNGQQQSAVNSSKLSPLRPSVIASTMTTRPTTENYHMVTRSGSVTRSVSTGSADDQSADNSTPDGRHSPGRRDVLDAAISDPAIEEHFRRSLGRNYPETARSGSPERAPVAPPPTGVNNTTDKNISITGCVDDHFAKSLGDSTWSRIKARNDPIQELFTGSVDDHFHKALGDTWLRIQAESEAASDARPPPTGRTPSTGPHHTSIIT